MQIIIGLVVRGILYSILGGLRESFTGRIFLFAVFLIFATSLLSILLGDILAFSVILNGVKFLSILAIILLIIWYGYKFIFKV